MSLPDTPLSQEARALHDRLMARIDERLAEVDRVPVGVLLWGPGIESSHPLGQVRLTLRSDLRQSGHAAFYSEELCDPSKPFSIRMQQLAQAQNFDLIVSLPYTPGSLAEVHDFAADRRVFSKLLVFLNEAHISGYSAKSLEAMSTILSCQLEYYPSETDTDSISRRTMEEVQKIRELKYISGGRYL